MTGPRLNTRALAVIAAAVALAVGITLIATSGGGLPGHAGRTPARTAQPAATTARAPQPPAPPPKGAFPHTPNGAVEAATNWYLRAGQALVNGTMDQTVAAFGAPALRSAGLGPASVYDHARLTVPGATPYAVRQWPLGYRVVQYAPRTANVLVWAQFVLETNQPTRELGYETNTIKVQWLDGTWKFVVMHPGPRLTPPGAYATDDQITAWVEAVNRLRSYTYAP